MAGEICKPNAVCPGEVERCDYKHVRNGTANLFMMVQPLRGWRHVNVTTPRSKVEFTKQAKKLSDVRFAKADRITLVMDSLNTHQLSMLHDVFKPSEARRNESK